MEAEDTYSLHGTGVGVCSNELECVEFMSLKNFMRELVPREGAYTAMTNLNSHGPAPLQPQMFGVKISFVA